MTAEISLWWGGCARAHSPARRSLPGSQGCSLSCREQGQHRRRCRSTVRWTEDLCVETNVSCSRKSVKKTVENQQNRTTVTRLARHAAGVTCEENKRCSEVWVANRRLRLRLRRRLALRALRRRRRKNTQVQAGLSPLLLPAGRVTTQCQRNQPPAKLIIFKHKIARL